MLEYWSSSVNEYKFPKNVSFESKMETDLYEFVKVKTIIINIAFNKSGKKMAILSKDRKIRLFDFLTGKIINTIDESLDQYSALQQVSKIYHQIRRFFKLESKNSQQMGNMEFGRRMAMEKDIERNEATFFQNLIFDESGIFLVYGTLLGIKSKRSKINQKIKNFLNF